MSKTTRTVRMDSGISKRLDAICVRHGDVTWHIENALTEYMANRQNAIDSLEKPGNKMDKLRNVV